MYGSATERPLSSSPPISIQEFVILSVQIVRLRTERDKLMLAF